MHGTRGKLVGVVAAIAAAGLLAACGSNDSTAKSTPTLTTTSAAAAAPTTPAAGTPSTTDQQAPQPAPDSATSSPERPQPVPSQFITTPSGSPALTDKQKGFLDDLKKAGITPGSSDIAITAADLVCQGKAENAPQDQIITYVTAIAGSDPSFDQSKMSVEQAGKIYYDVASKSYCSK
ncbi:DUF732 domain-containing protein [Nocardia heshunensis]